MRVHKATRPEPTWRIQPFTQPAPADQFTLAVIERYDAPGHQSDGRIVVTLRQGVTLYTGNRYWRTCGYVRVQAPHSASKPGVVIADYIDIHAPWPSFSDQALLLNAIPAINNSPFTVASPDWAGYIGWARHVRTTLEHWGPGRLIAVLPDRLISDMAKLPSPWTEEERHL